MAVLPSQRERTANCVLEDAVIFGDRPLDPFGQLNVVKVLRDVAQRLGGAFRAREVTLIHGDAELLFQSSRT